MKTKLRQVTELSFVPVAHDSQGRPTSSIITYIPPEEDIEKPVEAEMEGIGFDYERGVREQVFCAIASKKDGMFRPVSPLSILFALFRHYLMIFCSIL